MTLTHLICQRQGWRKSHSPTDFPKRKSQKREVSARKTKDMPTSAPKVKTLLSDIEPRRVTPSNYPSVGLKMGETSSLLPTSLEGSESRKR